MTPFDFDVCVVGDGAAGLGCGYAVAGRVVAGGVLGKEGAHAQGGPSRNSEVVHGGLFYPTGSLKARLCVAGRRALYPFLDTHQIAYDRCGKLVVATKPDQVEPVETIM